MTEPVSSKKTLGVLYGRQIILDPGDDKGLIIRTTSGATSSRGIQISGSGGAPAIWIQDTSGDAYLFTAISQNNSVNAFDVALNPTSSSNAVCAAFASNNNCAGATFVIDNMGTGNTLDCKSGSSVRKATIDRFGNFSGSNLYVSGSISGGTVYGTNITDTNYWVSGATILHPQNPNQNVSGAALLAKTGVAVINKAGIVNTFGNTIILGRTSDGQSVDGGTEIMTWQSNDNAVDFYGKLQGKSLISGSNLYASNGFTGNGAFTNFTISGGIILSAT